MLLEPEAVAQGIQLLEPDDFYHEAHRAIFRAIQVTFAKSEPVDLTTVTKTLRGKKKLQDCGGAAYLSVLMEAPSTAARIEHYAGMVLESAKRRRLIESLEASAKAAYDEEVGTDEIVDGVLKGVEAVRDRKADITARPLKEFMGATYDFMLEQREEFVKHGRVPYGVLFGMTNLDVALTGLRPPDFCLVKGLTGAGKTAFLFQSVIYSSIFAKDKQPSLLFPLEMEVRREVLPRVLGSITGVSSQKLRFGSTSEEDIAKVVDGMKAIEKGTVFVCPRRRLYRRDIEREIRHGVREWGIKLVVVDYLQKVRTVRADDRWNELGANTDFFAELAGELGIVIIGGSQITIGTDGRRMAWGGRQQEHDAPVMLDIQSSKDDNRDGIKPEAGFIKIEKNRQGRSGARMEYVFVPGPCRFRDPQDIAFEDRQVRQDARFD